VKPGGGEKRERTQERAEPGEKLVKPGRDLEAKSHAGSCAPGNQKSQRESSFSRRRVVDGGVRRGGRSNSTVFKPT